MKRNNVGIKTDAGIIELTSRIQGKGIALFDVSPVEEGCVFYVGKRDVSRVVSMLRQEGKKAEVTDKRSFQTLPEKILSRIGIIIGLILFAVALFFYSSFITSVSVSSVRGEEIKGLEEEIKEIISMPLIKRDVDLKELKKQICLCEGVSDAAVETDGNVLFVTVLEELPKTPMPGEEVGSKFDAVITKIDLYEGECLVKVGDVVKEGDILIKENGKTAKGDIYGRVWYTEQLIITQERIRMERTGRMEKVYVSTESEVKYGGIFRMYEKETREVILPFVIPIKAKEITYYEVEEKTEKVDFEAEKDHIISEAFEKMAARLPAERDKIKKWFLIKTVDKMKVLDLYYEIEIKISS